MTSESGYGMEAETGQPQPLSLENNLPMTTNALKAHLCLHSFRPIKLNSLTSSLNFTF